MRLTRREFVKCGAVTLGAAFSFDATVASAKEPSSMSTRPIRSAENEEALPVIGMGTWNTFDVGTSIEQRAPLIEVLTAFYAAGGRTIDSSPMYGKAERATGDLVHHLGRSANTFFATKVWTTGRDRGLAQIEQSMRLLRAPRVDLLQIHNLLDWRTHAVTLRQLQDSGRIRYRGVTHYSVGAHGEMESVLRSEDFDFAQFNYSIATRDAERRLLPFCQDRGIAVLINRPFEEGALFTRVHGRPLPAYAAELDCNSWAQFFLKFILSHPAVTCVIPATSRVNHMRDNMQAGVGRLPDAKMRERMAKELDT